MKSNIKNSLIELMAIIAVISFGAEFFGKIENLITVGGYSEFDTGFTGILDILLDVIVLATLLLRTIGLRLLVNKS
jgi:hypothetical protein